jgi:hypothetical protein
MYNMNGENTEEYLTLDARGTFIKIPYDTAKKSPVLKAYINNENRKPYYLNYSAKIVNNLIDYLEYDDMYSKKIYRICDELCVNRLNSIDVMHIRHFATVSTVKIREYLEKMKQYNYSFNREVYDILKRIENQYRGDICVDSLKDYCFKIYVAMKLSCISFYIGIHSLKTDGLQLLLKSYNKNIYNEPDDIKFNITTDSEYFYIYEYTKLDKKKY